MPLDLDGALVKLGKAFPGLGWDFRKQTGDPSPEIVSYWPGDPNEDVMVCVLKDGQINEPFLIFHGLEDPVVPYRQSITLYEGLCSRGIPADLYLVEEAGHADPRFYQAQTREIILEFLQKH